MCSDSEDDDHPVYRSFVPAHDMLPPPPSRHNSAEFGGLSLGAAATPLVWHGAASGGGIWPWDGAQGKASAPTVPSPRSDAPDAPHLSRQITREERFDFPPPLDGEVLFHMGSRPETRASPPRSRRASPAHSETVSPDAEPLLQDTLPAPPLNVTPPALTPSAFRASDGDVGVFVALHATGMHRRSQSEGAVSVDDLIDDLAHEWARLKLETNELRTLFSSAAVTMEQLAASNASIMADVTAIRTGPHTTLPPPSPAELPQAIAAAAAAARPPIPSALAPDAVPAAAAHLAPSEQRPLGLPRGSAVVVEDEGADLSDDDDASDGDGGDGASRMHGDGDLGNGEDEPMYVYRGLSASPPPLNPDDSESCSHAAATATLHGGRSCASSSSAKRGRSHTSELAAEPLHPAKQSSEPSSRVRSSRGSPSAEQMQVVQLRELIQTEQAEREALLQAFRENQVTLERLRRTNAELLAELARLRQSNAHHS